MNINELGESNYLKKEDCGTKGLLVTIKGVQKKNLAQQGDEPDYKYVLYFDEHEKGMVLNKTNGQIIANITGSEDSQGWVGKRVVIYHNPNIQFAGKLVGGIRVREARNLPPQRTAPVQQGGQPPVQQRNTTAPAQAEQDLDY